MNLIIDVGNTLVKFAVFNQGEIVYKNAIQTDQFDETIFKIKSHFNKIEKGIIASVGEASPNGFNFEKMEVPFLQLNHLLNFPFKNKYKTPKTLGVDRIALVSSAAVKFPKSDVLIIDAGTCITYDFINKENEYLGGAISPGLRLRYKSLNDFTVNLPLLSAQKPDSIIGGTTVDSIHSGVVYGITNEIKASILNYQQQYPDLTVILTGGDGDFLSKQLKNGIFANSNFLLEGLNFILEHNT